MIGHSVAWSEAARLCDRSRSAEDRAVRARPAPWLSGLVFLPPGQCQQTKLSARGLSSPRCPCGAPPFFTYMFGGSRSLLQHVGSSSFIVAREQPFVARGVWSPDQRGTPGPLHWEYGASAPGPPGKSLWAPLTVSFLAQHPLLLGQKVNGEAQPLL